MEDDPPVLSGWLGKSADSDSEHPFKTNENRRYDKGNLLGWGGMGTVHSAEDLRLRREVAWKQGTDARLPQEAWIAAQLEHPGIVPVYDAGHDEDGRPFYTMRLIRGSTLAAVLAETAGLEERLRLIRPFLAVCQAMAYAHNHGIVHRDLKPSNIMVGEFGETQVVDWGVARPLDMTDDEGGEDWIPAEHRAHTMAGAVVGTPAYMSPEQATGRPPDTRADVWSLGIILYEIIGGAPPFSGSDSTEILEEVVGNDVPPPSEGAPPVLAAIVNRALSRDLSLRYRTAEQLALEVEAWLDGRRVFAHDYTATELLIDFVRTWRVPLAAAGIALLGMAAAAGIATIRIDQARLAAEAAERDTRDALETADERLADALAARSADAFLRGIAPEAELLASQALILRESPTARGVLAGSDGVRLQRLSVREKPCARPRLSPTGELAYCDSLGISVWDANTGSLRFETDETFQIGALDEHSQRALAVDKNNQLVVLDLDTGELIDREDVIGGLIFGTPDRGVTVITNLDGTRLYDGATGKIRQIRSCEASTTAGAARGHGRLLVLCSDGSWELGPENGPVQPYEPILRFPVTAAAWMDHNLLAVALSGGQISVVDIEGRKIVRTHASHGGRVMDIVASNGLIIAKADQLAPMLIAPNWRTRLPADVAQARVNGGEFTTTGKSGIERWNVPEMPLLEVWTGAGITSVDPSQDGKMLAVTDGNSFATIWSTEGPRLATLSWQQLVVKGGAFSRDGRHYGAAGMGAGGIHIFDTTTWELATKTPETARYRRVAPFGPSGFIGLDYAGSSGIFDENGSLSQGVRQTVFFDAGASGSGVALLASDSVWVHDGKARRVLDFPDGQAVDLADDGRIAACTLAEIVVSDGQGHVLQRFSSDEPIIDIAWSPDGRWIAAGTMAGSAAVYSVEKGRLWALLPGHAERVATVAFSPDGRWLYSGSWDGTARRWSVSALEADASEWLRQSERTWARSAADAVSARL